LLAGQELGKLLAEMVASLLAAGAASPGIAHWMGVQTVDMWEYVKTHAELQEWLNNKLKTVLVELLDVEQQLAAIVVEEALQKMSDEALSQFVEDKAGEDLAWIRINGSVVGAIVGLFLFLLLHYGYAPLLGL
jgi:uncharacterized membrane-anchored protein YjiN (DUF445 family)